MKFQNFLKFEDINKETLQGVMKQYCEFKVQYLDFIVLFRIGDFYETYFEDAIEFSNSCGIALTRKNYINMKNVPMAGINKKQLFIYVQKLVSTGYKVVVVEQTEDIGQNGIRKREVYKTYTQGTLIDLELLNPKENNYIASIYKKGKKYEFCYADISTGAIRVSVCNFEEIKCELARISAKELLVPLNNIEEEIYSSYKAEFLTAEYYEGNEDNFALRALLNYAKYILKRYFPKLENPKNYDVQKNLLIDFLTRKNLELTKNSYNNKTYGSLFWALDKTKTPMGKRLLSSFISTPLYDLAEIKTRQNAIKEFLDNHNAAEELGALLENTGDIARLTSRLSNGTITPMEFYILKEGLKNFKRIEDILSGFKSPLFKSDGNKILIDYCDILLKTIEDDVDKIKNGDFIKKGANPELDFLYEKYENTALKIKEYEKKLAAFTKISSLKIVKKAGNYSIEIPSSIINPIGADFRLVQRLKSTSRYTTDVLIDLEEEILALSARILALKNEIYSDLREYSKEMTEHVREYSKKLAVADTIYSLYSSAQNDNLTCPVIGENCELEITNGRHIAAQKILGRFDPMSVNFKNSKFIMLTGANGIGKSTLLKELAIIIILAQSGAFVPSDKAVLPLADKLFTILNISDEFINKKSCHQAQMFEVANIINNATSKSVILLDEIGKSTNHKEGMALSYGIIRYLLQFYNSKTIFATHYLFLKELLAGENLRYVEITAKNGKRTVEEGVASSSGGIISASNEGLPEQLLKYANEALVRI